MVTNFVKLISNDNKTFEVDVAVAMESEMVKVTVEAKGIDKPILLPRVSGDTVTKVVEYCRYHVESQKSRTATPEDEIKAWDADFMNVDRKLFSLLPWYEIEAANTLKINNLLDLVCVTFAKRITGKNSEQIRKLFDVPNDFVAGSNIGDDAVEIFCIDMDSSILL